MSLVEAYNTVTQMCSVSEAYSIYLHLIEVHEGLDGGVWYSLFIKNLAHLIIHLIKFFGLFIKIKPIIHENYFIRVKWAAMLQNDF